MIVAASNFTNTAREIELAAARARLALVSAIEEPGNCKHRVDLTNALNYIETIRRQSGDPT